MQNAKYFIFLSVIISVGAVLFVINKYTPADNPKDSRKTLPGQLTSNFNNMEITSSAFGNNGNIPRKYTCDGENISPPLEFSDIPADTLSLVLILHDPDAPAPGGFTHWIIFDMSPSTKEIAENSSPADAVQGQNGSGQPKYTGPCPPSGTHHYEFRLYALDEKLTLDSSAKKADIEKAIAGHIIEQNTLTGLYKRQ